MAAEPRTVPPIAEPDPSPARALLGRGSVYAIAVAIQASAGVIVLPLLTRLLDPAQLGVVSLALVVQFTLGTVAALGLPAAVLRAFFKEQGLAAARQIVAWTALAATAVGAVALATVSGWAGAIGASGDEGTLRIAVISAMGLAILTSTQSLLRAQDRAGMYVATAVLATIGGQILGVVSIAAVDGGPEAYFAGVTAGVLGAAGLGAAAVGSGVTNMRSGSRVGTALRIGLPTVPHSLGIYVLAAGDRTVIARLEELASVGQYQVAYVIGALALTFLSAANNAWTPLVFGASESRRWQTLAETAAILWRLLPCAVGILALGAPALLAVAAPASYDPDALSPVTAIVSVAAVPQLLYMGAFIPLYWAGRMGALAWITPLAAAGNLLLNIVLIPHLGLEGAAISTVLAYAGMAGLIWWRAAPLADVPWPLATMAGNGLLCLALAAVGALAPVDGAWLIARLAVAAGLLTTAAAFVRSELRPPENEAG